MGKRRRTRPKRFLPFLFLDRRGRYYVKALEGRTSEDAGIGNLSRESFLYGVEGIFFCFSPFCTSADHMQVCCSFWSRSATPHGWTGGWELGRWVRFADWFVNLQCSVVLRWLLETPGVGEDDGLCVPLCGKSDVASTLGLYASVFEVVSWTHNSILFRVSRFSCSTSTCLTPSHCPFTQSRLHVVPQPPISVPLRKTTYTSQTRNQFVAYPRLRNVSMEIPHEQGFERGPKKFGEQ